MKRAHYESPRTRTPYSLAWTKDYFRSWTPQITRLQRLHHGHWYKLSPAKTPVHYLPKMQLPAIVCLLLAQGQTTANFDGMDESLACQRQRPLKARVSPTP